MVRNLHLICSLALFIFCVDHSYAQSGSKSGRVAERKQPPKANSNQTSDVPKKQKPEFRSFNSMRPGLGLNGNDPVLLQSADRLIPGDPEINSQYDAITYYFKSVDQKKQFEENPQKYIPVLSGDSIVALHETFLNKPGKHDIFLVYSGRSYLFQNQEELNKFKTNPDQFLDADLALQGLSPVSLVDEEVLKPGSKNISITFDGRRIYFANEEEKIVFDEEPGRYYPSLGGIDPISMVQSDPKMGLARYSVIYKNRLYSFSSNDNQNAFIENPVPYSDQDVAFDGKCPVTYVELKESTTGHYGISTIYRGQRFLFTSENNREKFRLDPEFYVRGISN